MTRKKRKKRGSGSRPIEAVGTSIAAFVGLAPPKPLRAVASVLVVALAVRAVRGRRRH